MEGRLQQGQPIRMMDPLFRELWEHADQIDLKCEAVEGGVRATHTSQDPQVVLLIPASTRGSLSMRLLRKGCRERWSRRRSRGL